MSNRTVVLPGTKAKKAAPRYVVQQEEERWVIVCARDPDLVWSGYHWADREHRSTHPVSFSDQVSAAAYAREVFGGGE